MTAAPDSDPPVAATIGIFALAFVTLAFPWLSGAVTIPWDAKAQFQPQLQFLAASLARGEAPWWTPHVFAGFPQIADPQSLIFSPLHFLLALVDPAPGFRLADAVLLAYLFLGGLGMILLFRDRGWHPAGALVAALAFAFGGAAAARLQHIGEVISLAWLPVALWLLIRTLERASWRAGLAAGPVIGLLALGRDQVALLGLYVVVGVVLAHWIQGGAETVRRTFAPLAAAAAVALLVAALPVLMTALLAAQSNRPVIAFARAGQGSLHPAHLLTLGFTDLYGAADPNVDYWGPPSPIWGPTGLFLAQNMGQLYLGALPLIAVVGLGVGRGLAWSRDIRAFTVLTALVLLYALGWYTPIFRLMYEVMPGVASFRRPADAAFVLCALLALLAGYLVHRALSRGLPAATGRARSVSVILAIAILASGIGVAYQKHMLAAAAIPLVTGLAFMAAALVVLMSARRLATAHPVMAVLLVAVFMTGDLAWNNAPNESTGLSPARYDHLRPDTNDETVRLLKAKLAAVAAPDRRDRVELVAVGYEWPNIGLIHGFEHVFGHNPVRLRDFVRATGADDTIAIPMQRHFTPLFPSYRSVFADLIGLRFIASGVPIERLDSSLQPGDLVRLATTRDALVYENPRALPRVMVVPSWQQADFGELIRSGWLNVDPRRTVLLEQPPPDQTSARGSAAGEDAARILRYTNTEVVVDATTSAGGFLLLNDVWHPWWRARVDGVAAPILKANVMFRAVALGPGRHEVRFAFHPLAGAWAELAEKLTPPPSWR